jgi:hypothetical protein
MCAYSHYALVIPRFYRQKLAFDQLRIIAYGNWHMPDTKIRQVYHKESGILCHLTYRWACSPYIVQFSESYTNFTHCSVAPQHSPFARYSQNHTLTTIIWARSTSPDSCPFFSEGLQLPCLPSLAACHLRQLGEAALTNHTPPPPPPPHHHR